MSKTTPFSKINFFLAKNLSRNAFKTNHYAFYLQYAKNERKKAIQGTFCDVAEATRSKKYNFLLEALL